MKTLSIKQKAERYDEVLRKAKITLDCCNPASIVTKNTIYDIFPELKEPDDEEVRKEILDFCKDRARKYSNDPKYKNIKAWIEWLEKQDVSKVVIPRFNIGDVICDKSCTTLNKGSQHNFKITDIRNGMYICNDCSFPISQQDEYELVIKSKFNEGDWVVSNDTGLVHQIKTCIENLQSHKYGYDLMDGGYISSDEVNYYHPWTIEDAKDGDVLVDIYNNIGIFQLRVGICWHSHIYIGNGGKLRGFGLGGSHGRTGTHPATKEQCELIKKAMDDAGYTFDSDQKELKEVESPDKYEGLTDFEKGVVDICIGWIGEEPGWKQYIKENADALLKIAIKKFNAVQDTPTESKTTWGKDDDRMFGYALAMIEWYSGEHENKSRLVSDWLKSIRQRYTWKPSDEQFKVLNEVLNFAASHESPHWNDYIFGTLNNLVRQLKKLV